MSLSICMGREAARELSTKLSMFHSESIVPGPVSTLLISLVSDKKKGNSTFGTSF